MKTIENNDLRLSFLEGDEYVISLDDFNDGQIKYALARAFHDYVNDAGTSGGATATDEDKKERRAKAFESIKAGNVPSGGSRQSLTPFELERRNLVTKLFMKLGKKKSEADKLAKGNDWLEVLSKATQSDPAELAAKIKARVDKSLAELADFDI